MEKVLITDADGFISKSVATYLKNKKIEVIEGTRESYLAFIEIVVDLEDDVDAAFTLALASKVAGIKRFIYMSSIQDKEENSFESLLKLHEAGLFEVVIIRTPFVYGPGINASFDKLMIYIHRDLPLPFGLVKNKFSLVSILNLCDLISVILTHPSAGGEVFLVRDIIDYSFRELIIEIANIKNKTPHLLPIPINILKFLLRILGKNELSDWMFRGKCVDISKNKELLDWVPPYVFQETFKS